MRREEKEFKQHAARAAAKAYKSNAKVLIQYGSLNEGYTHKFDLENVIVITDKGTPDPRIQDLGSLDLNKIPKNSRENENTVYLRCVFN
jgi:hypothetical protein